MNSTKFKKIIKDNKLRLTKPRTVIFEQLSKSQKALSVKEVFEVLKSQKISTDLASVYRNLDLLNELHILHKFQDGKYKICNHEHDHKHGHSHIHIIYNCTSCSRTEEISSHSKNLCKIASELKKHSSALEETQEIVLNGVCKKCS